MNHYLLDLHQIASLEKNRFISGTYAIHTGSLSGKGEAWDYTCQYIRLNFVHHEIYGVKLHP